MYTNKIFMKVEKTQNGADVYLQMASDATEN